MLIIGISGGSGSGKTSFIREIRNRFVVEDVTVLSQDEYYHPREQQFLDENGVHNFDLPSALDLDAFVADINRLRSGASISRKEYTFNNAQKEAQTLTIKPSKILIVEGLFIFHNQMICDQLDFKIMVYASSALAVIRRIQRDQVERNYPLEDVLYRYERHVLPSFQKYIEPYMEDVDLIINNNRSYDRALDMLTGYLREIIRNGAV